jgi:O-antigen/teichoic acid export membrane protein
LIEDTENINTKLDFSSGAFKKYFANTSWLFFERVLRILITFIVTVFVVRYLGPKDFGLLSYVLSFFMLFSVIGILGLESITVRELVKFPDKRDELVGTVFFLRLLGAFTLIALIIFTLLIIKEDLSVSILILFAASSSIFHAFSAIEYYFRARVQAKYNAYALFLSVILAALLKIIFILIKAPLIYFVLAFTAEFFFLAIGLIWVYKFNCLKLIRWKFSKALSTSLLKDSWPLMLTGIVVVIYMKIDQIMIKHMINEEAVGLYAVAVRLCEAWYFIPVTICNSLFPAIVNAKNVSLIIYNNRLQKLYDILAWISIAIAIPITIFSADIIRLLFGTDFLQAAPVLTVYIWAGVAVFLGVASSQYLITENFTKLAFSRSFIGMVVNVLLNLALIPKYGIIGAAYATLVSYSLATFSILFFRKTTNQFILMLKSVLLITFFQYGITLWRSRSGKNLEQ